MCVYVRVYVCACVCTLRAHVAEDDQKSTILETEVKRVGLFLTVFLMGTNTWFYDSHNDHNGARRRLLPFI